MSNWLNYTALHATNPKLTRAVYTAVVDIHSKRLAKRLANFAALGQAVLAHAAALYGPNISETLWLALRPHRVEAALAHNKTLWLQRVIGMLVNYDLARNLVSQAVQQPIKDAELTDAQRAWTKAHNLPARVGAWVFYGSLTQPTGWQLCQQLLPDVDPAQLAAYLQVPQAALKRAVQVLLPAFGPLPATWQTLNKPAAPAPKAAMQPAAPSLGADPQLLHTVRRALQQAATHQASFQEVLPLALNLASLVNALRQFARIKSLHIVAPSITSGGLHELASTLDQALVIDQAEVSIVCNTKFTPSCAADLQELQHAGAMLYTPADRPLGAHLLSVEFEAAALSIIGSSDVSASAYHTSLELDTLMVSPREPTAAWWASLQPMLKPLVPTVASPSHRTHLLVHTSDALANFKAQIAKVKDVDTHQRLVAWLRYLPKPPVAMQLGEVAYFALAFPQYHTVVIDTFTPNNALFYAHGLGVEHLTQATSKQDLLALGAKRAYHTNEPIRKRVARILS